MFQKVKEKFCGLKYKMAAKKLLLQDRVKEAKEIGWKEDNRGIAIIEVILILVILMGVIVIFRDKIEEIVRAVFESIMGDKDKTLKDITV